MPKAYIVANIHPTGAASPPPEYFEGFRRVLAKHAGKRIIASNDIDYREGKLGIGRLLVIEFADKPTAVACYEEYAKDIVPLNPSKFKRELFIVEGAD